MRIILSILFSFILNHYLSQIDTVKFDYYIEIYKDGKIIKKEFKNEQMVKIVYCYDSVGVLVRRYWYDKNNRLIGVSLE